MVIFLLHAQNSWDRLQTNVHPDQDKVLSCSDPAEKTASIHLSDPSCSHVIFRPVSAQACVCVCVCSVLMWIHYIYIIGKCHYLGILDDNHRKEYHMYFSPCANCIIRPSVALDTLHTTQGHTVILDVQWSSTLFCLDVSLH